MQTDTDTPNIPASEVMAGLLNRAQLAAVWHCSERTVIRRERAGMPFIQLGMLRLYEPAKVRAWMLEHERRPSAPKVGRPRKIAA